MRHALVLLALLLVWPSPSVTGAGQEWRETFVASFDEAWQAINDTYPDPSFGGLDWPAVRTELRPRAISAESPEAVREVIREMIARLGQSHFELLTGGGTRVRGEARVAIDLRVIGGEVVIVRVEPGSAAADAGLEPGAIVRAVDGEPATAWIDEARSSGALAETFETISLATTALSGTAGSEAVLVVAGVDGERTVTVRREKEKGQSVRFGNLPPIVVRVETSERQTPGGRRAGVIGFNVWMPAATAGIDQAVDRFRDADGLVIDLRGNPGGLVEMIRGVAGHVLDEPISLGRLQTRQGLLKLEANPRRSTSDGRSVTPFAGPVAILVDGLTASASECFAGSLQSLGRARVFGRQTVGQALPAATRRLPNGDVLMHVLGDFVTPTGVRLEARGVVPDQIVPMSVEALRAGRDDTLEAALEWIDLARGARDAGGLP